MKKFITTILLFCALAINAQLRDAPLVRGEKEEYVELEGFFGKGFEYRNFYILKNNELSNPRMWVYFSDELYAADSLDFLTRGKSRPSYYHGVYMKVGGIKKWGRKDNRTYMGGSESQLIITQIFELDTSRTRWGHIIGNILEKGYYKYGKAKLSLPLVLKPYKEYRYAGSDKDYTYVLIINTENNSTIQYNLKYLKDGTIVREVNGIKYINLYDLMSTVKYPEEAVYPVFASYHDWQGRGTSISFLKEKVNGKQIIEFSVPTTDPFQPIVRFIEVTSD